MFILFTGDIAELRDSVKIDEEHIAAFSDECSTMSKRFSLMDVSENAIACCIRDWASNLELFFLKKVVD